MDYNCHDELIITPLLAIMGKVAPGQKVTALVFSNYRFSTRSGSRRRSNEAQRSLGRSRRNSRYVPGYSLIKVSENH